MSMEFAFDRMERRKERLAFIRSYAAWVKRTPNPQWSGQQAVLIDSLLENSRNMPLSLQLYLERIAGRKTGSPFRVKCEPGTPDISDTTIILPNN